MSKRLSKSQKTLNKALRSQRTQSKRINKMIADLEMQGFTFDYKFKQRINNLVSSTPSNAKRKAKQLKAITKTELYKHAQSYITDDYQILTGQEGIKQGRKIQRKKNKLARQASGIQNVDDAISNMADFATHDTRGTIGGGVERVDKEPIKRKIAKAWEDYKEDHAGQISASFMGDLLNDLDDFSYSLPSDASETTEYDAKAQKIYHKLTGVYLNADDIGGDEGISDVS